MMKELRNNVQKIDSLIDILQKYSFQESAFHIDKFKELLILSDKSNYLYGQAIAHIYLAQSYQISKQEDLYEHHLRLAKSMAKKHDYVDVMMIYHNLKGFDYAEQSDELSAMSAYLKGADLAIELKDDKSCAKFYNNIAEIFYDDEAYQDALEFYLKAIALLENSDSETINVYKKTIYINLVFVYGHLQQVREAQRYMKKCRDIQCTAGILPLIELEASIQVLIVENKKDKAIQASEALIEMLAKNDLDPIIQQPIYLYLLEILILIEKETAAAWCLDKIETLYSQNKPTISMKIEKLKMLYHRTFHKNQDKLYEEFYHVAIKNERLNKQYMVNSFRGSFSLYEARKLEQSMLNKQEYLQDAADRDGLTHLYNRRYISKLFSKFKQDDRIKSLAYMMIDIDYFKEYNDDYGHLKGDEVLCFITKTLQAASDQDSYASRYGGDEFACLFVNKSKEEIALFIKYVQEELSLAHVDHRKSKHHDIVTLSFGVYNEEDTKSFQEQALIKKADLALYQAKKMGRNTSVFFK